MAKLLTSVLCAILLSAAANAAPAGHLGASASATASASAEASTGAAASGTISALPEQVTVAHASDDPNSVLWNVTVADPPTNSEAEPYQPIRGSLGATIIAQQNPALQQMNPDLLAGPTTDNGDVPNLKWPFSMSNNRLQTGGWARQQNVDQMPIATSMAGVDMRLEAGAIRELHWHQTAEWAYVLSGYMQVTAVDENGRNFLSTVGPGDLWYFPPGIPHSLQATNQTAEGAEFLLVFNSGDFSEDSTFLLTDWLAHTPKEVLAKNFGTTISAFDNIPAEQLYIFPGAPPSPDAAAPEDPQGQAPLSYTYKLSEVTPTEYAGGFVRNADANTFNVSTGISVSDVTVQPGGMREMHWHPTQNEWTYYISGSARVTVFASSSTARTWNYEPGDIGYVPASYGHYIENIGDTDLHFLEIFDSDVVQDISLNQWLAVIPTALVEAHLDLDEETMSMLSKTKPVIVGSTGV
ncbi:oxalate decarboxylase [Laetiporus sulphureus 93-53]|uniref:Oxalate decarboxylase n=1 Tax=Laetiporus sulphureus 93-53 TaxID=1314785 RepID=A0A165CCS1_9APHY|nr:oxalate decarboxylase [Laetiporus sulphureus 93-53]KZT02575.1 oxalate decarboxylase [Laetiporus sulphureus 93-53]